MRLLPRNLNRSLLSLLPLSLNPKPLVAQRVANFFPLFFERDYVVEDSTMLFMIWKALWQAVRVPSIPFHVGEGFRPFEEWRLPHHKNVNRPSGGAEITRRV